MEIITPQDIIDVLNEMLKLDPVATRSLIATRTSCNEKLADHPSIQVASSHDRQWNMNIGLIGIINGFFKNNNPIGYVIDYNGVEKFILRED